MKKILLTLVAMFAIVGMASAKNPVTVKSGSLNELKSSNAKIFVVYDYANETLDGKPVKEWVAKKDDRSLGKIEVERTEAQKSLAETWTKISENGIKIVDSEKAADYVLTIHFADLSYGSAAASLIVGFGAGNAHMSADATLTKGGNTVAELQIKKLAIDGFDSKKDIRNWAYMILAADIDKAIKKSK